MALDPVHDILPDLLVYSEDGHRLGTVKEVTPDTVHDSLPDLPVYSEDGDGLGTVKEVTLDRIKVVARLETDYWVSRGHVLSFTAERVTLDVAAEQVDGVKQRLPG